MNRPAVRLLTIGLALAALPVRQTMLSEWTLRVRDETGTHLPDLAVSQEWQNYTFAMDGGRDEVTDSSGTVVFPPVVFWRPAIYWLMRTVPVLLNVHGGWGERSGRVQVRDLAVEMTPGTGLGRGCSGARCTAGPIESELRAFLKAHSEASTQSYLALNRPALESLAEDWAKEPAATFLQRHGTSEYWWGEWHVFPDGRSFVASGAGSRSITAGSLDEAVRQAGLDPAMFHKWLARATQLEIYSISTREGGLGVEIRLFPGAHGLHYAPVGDDRSYEILLRPRPSPLDPRRPAVLKPLSGRWFYFADSAPDRKGRF